MDKLKINKLFQQKIDFYLNEHLNKISKLASWQINQIIPSSLLNSSYNEKQNYLIERFKKENPLFLKLQADLDLLNSNANINSLNQLKSINVDPREIEGMGFNESQIEEFNHFIEQVQRAYNQH